MTQQPHAETIPSSIARSLDTYFKKIRSQKERLDLKRQLQKILKPLVVISLHQIPYILKCFLVLKEVKTQNLCRISKIETIITDNNKDHKIKIIFSSRENQITP